MNMKYEIKYCRDCHVMTGHNDGICVKVENHPKAYRFTTEVI